MRRLSIILVLLLALSGGLTAARVALPPAGAATDGGVVLAWNQQVLDAIVATETGPTVAARALAVVHTAIYDAWAAYDSVAGDTRGRLRADPALRRPAADRTVDNKRKAVSFAAYAALVDLFPSKAVDFAGFMTGLGYDPAVASPDAIPDPTTPEGVGTLAARAVLAYRDHDGANQLGDEPDRTTTNLEGLRRLHRVSAGQYLGSGQQPRQVAAAVPTFAAAGGHQLRRRGPELCDPILG